MPSSMIINHFKIHTGIIALILITIFISLYNRMISNYDGTLITSVARSWQQLHFKDQYIEINWHYR